MLKRPITYENFDGETVTEIHYFNLSKAELLEMEMGFEGGFANHMQRIIEARDHKSLIKEFKMLVLLAYGVRSEDGKRFIKNDQVREEFTQTAAYDALFMELAMDDTKAAEFLNGIVPKDLSDALQSMPKNFTPATVPLNPPPPPPVTNVTDL